MRYGMLIDLRKCVACEACTVACKMENDVARGRRRTRVWESDYGSYPQVTKIKVPTLCNHCQEPPCLDVCPTGATYRTEEGVVLIDPGNCIGCGYCVSACPYEARFKDPVRDIVDKCTLCYHRIREGLIPACVGTCISHARIFGDLNDSKDFISKYIRNNNAVQVKGTAMYYVLPEGFDRSFIPEDLHKPGLINLWKNIIHPAGKVLMGASAVAVAAGVTLNAVKGGEKDGEK